MSFQSYDQGPISYLNQRCSGIWNWTTWAFGRVCFSCPGFQHAGLLVTSIIMGFLLIPLPPRELSPSWNFTVLGLHFVGAELRLFQPSKIWEMTPYMSGECVISPVLSRHSKDLKWGTDHCYSSVLFGKQRKIHPRGMRVGQPKRCKEDKERKNSILTPHFVCFFSSLEPALCKLG